MTEESRLEIHDVVLKESSGVGGETVECVPGLGNDLDIGADIDDTANPSWESGDAATEEDTSPIDMPVKTDSLVEWQRVTTVPAEYDQSEQKGLVNGIIPPLQTKGIKYAHLNIHSLVLKIYQLRVLLKNNPFNVISMNETLCDDSVSNSEVFIDGFAVYRRDRNRHGGGVAIYVSDKFNVKRRHDLESSVLENIWLEIRYPHKSPCLVGSFYMPPSSTYVFIV